jgi:hypothetical protein
MLPVMEEALPAMSPLTCEPGTKALDASELAVPAVVALSALVA